MKIPVSALFAISLVAPVQAQSAEKNDGGTEVGIFGGKGLQVLGSELRRTAYGASVAQARPERRLRIGGLPAQLVLEGYVLGTHSQANSFHAAQTDFGVGGLAFARYRWHRGRGVGVYANAGIGLIYLQKTNRDLPSHFDSTPYAGVGLSFPAPRGEYLLGLDFLHISNAGTVNHNLGANLLLLSLKYRF